ncbi:MAG: hypothetical protein OEZ58_14945 [Gammaproteobacteria bacterium]|nr:hypothetical protein [Gammaproteobacteria bacterium]
MHTQMHMDLNIAFTISGFGSPDRYFQVKHKSDYYRIEHGSRELRDHDETGFRQRDDNRRFKVSTDIPQSLVYDLLQQDKPKKESSLQICDGRFFSLSISNGNKTERFSWSEQGDITYVRLYWFCRSIEMLCHFEQENPVVAGHV